MPCKGILLATVSSLAILGAANIATAADLPARMPVKAPVVEPAPFSWTGFYIGVHGGGAWLDHKQSTLEPNGACHTGSFGPLTASECTLRTSGATFGGFAGYNLQSGRIVYGLEVDGSWLDLKKSSTFTFVPVTDPLTLHTKVSWLATVRGRLGITLSPTLIYVTGGAAFGGVKSGWFDGGTPPNGLSVDKTKVGWVAGGGIEHAFARNWLVRLEGLYHDLGKVSAGPMVNSGTYNTTFRHRIATVRGGVALRW
jgi:outer membrane immunogenic protein